MTDFDKEEGVYWYIIVMGAIDMIPTWLYNICIINRKRGALMMNLDFVLSKVGVGNGFSLVPNPPKEVSIESKEEFYIKPTLRDTFTTKDSKLILFSAPGATGKSALARYVSRSKHALLWDLSKDRIANHSFSGMLVESLGNKEFSRFTEGLLNGEAVLVVDALDEAEMISGRTAIETLLSDLRSAVLEASSPNVILCARTETAHFVRHFYEQEGNKLDISQYEISFFEETEAIDFVKRKIDENRRKENDLRPVTVATEQCVKTLFDEIKRLLDNDAEAIRSFIGYAPVLEALAVFCDEENNTMQLVQRISKANCSAEIFHRIMDHILDREHGKVVNGFKERCIDDYSGFDGWDEVYTSQEQFIRLINYVLFNEVDLSVFDNNLPRELQTEYNECVSSFLKDHPFLHTFERFGTPRIDFTGPAFRDYVLAHLMTDGSLGKDCDDYAQWYFADRQKNVRFPSQLYFDLYEFNAGGNMKLSHFKYLYDAFKSKERTKYVSFVSMEQVDDRIYCTFRQDNANKTAEHKEAEFCVEDISEVLQLIQFSNGYIDVDIDVVLGSDKEDVILSNTTIKCRKIYVHSANVMLVAEDGSELLLVCDEAIDTSKCPSAKFDLRVDKKELLKISVPEISNWYKLRDYAFSFEDESNLDVTIFENAVWAILKHFRKHGKDAPGKHREYIENIIVGGSELKKSVLNFFIEKGIIYQDSKDPRQFKLNNSALEALGVNWGMLSPNANRDMKSVLGAYEAWKGQ